MIKIKFLPIKSNRNTEIAIISDTAITLDSDDVLFPTDGVIWPDILDQSEGKIFDAHRELGILYLTIQRHYTGSCSQWDDGEYHEYKAGDSI